MDPLGCQHMIPDQRDQRAQHRRAGTDPIRQRRDIKVNALASIHFTLTIERLVIAEFAVQNHRQ